MREILFRGKRVDNGEWVEGNYILQNDNEPERGNYLKTYIKLRNYVNKYEVVPETVGQYTGLCDKNGKKVFEGDIVEGHCHSQWSHNLQRCVVEYSRYGFEAREYIEHNGNTWYNSYKVMFSKDVVVIGNIHDNPELLKEGTT